MSLVIGLTGGIASGKTTSSNYLKQHFKVIDCDKISHNLILKPNEGYNALVNAFGAEILDGDIISRKKLGDIVFNNPKKLEELNKILHPLIYQEVEKQIDEEFVVIDCPLLFESNFIKLCNKTLLIYTDNHNQIDRLIERDNLTKEDALNRIQLQMSLDKKINLSDYVIFNNKDVDYLYKELDKTIKLIKEEY